MNTGVKKYVFEHGFYNEYIFQSTSTNEIVDNPIASEIILKDMCKMDLYRDPYPKQNVNNVINSWDMLGM